MLIRIAFVLGNLTTLYHETMMQVGETGLHTLFDCLKVYWEKDKANLGTTVNPPGKKVAGQASNNTTEDALTKLIRVLANVLTAKEIKISIETKEFFAEAIDSLKRKSTETSEEYVLNLISCMTNFLYYDIPESGSSNIPSGLFETKEERKNVAEVLGGYVFASENEEIQIEAMRALSNLTRHKEIVEFVKDNKLLSEGIPLILDHTLRDLVFYNIGVVINLTQEESAKRMLQPEVGRLVEVLKDSNIEDLDLSKVACKALLNLAVDARVGNDGWKNEDIVKLDQVLSNIGEELDSILDMANEEELQELMGLRNLVNELVNSLPDASFSCPVEGCGRKFEKKAKLEEHMTRRHPGT